jgi:hypothetical protein
VLSLHFIRYVLSAHHQAFCITFNLRLFAVVSIATTLSNPVKFTVKYQPNLAYTEVFVIKVISHRVIILVAFVVQVPATSSCNSTIICVSGFIQ